MVNDTNNVAYDTNSAPTRDSLKATIKGLEVRTTPQLNAGDATARQRRRPSQAARR